ncbi:MAG: hypothetical protein QOE45_2952 [Frankiaceae bacterium]|nr:hypothetical protein [Frankiaceae bacterium]
MSHREIRACFDDNTLVVYQAYSSAIADAALTAGAFVRPFSRTRMTWIKPSFLWMMYRSGWATKHDQERVLAVRISRDGFAWALSHACLSHYDGAVHEDEETWREAVRTNPVRVQWDPDRDAAMNPLCRRAIQVGLSGEAVNRYVDEWIVSIDDVTPLVAHLRSLPTDRRDELLPEERPYPLPQGLRVRLGGS